MVVMVTAITIPSSFNVGSASSVFSSYSIAEKKKQKLEKSRKKNCSFQLHSYLQ